MLINDQFRRKETGYNQRSKRMEKPVLGDADQFPTQEIILKHIGKNRSLWLSFFKFIDGRYPEFKREWRYYRDGKSWLLKVTRKSKTIFWLSVIQGSFRTTFYFTEKAAEAIKAGSIGNHLKKQFNQKSRLRGITVVYNNRKDVEDAKELISIKMSIK